MTLGYSLRAEDKEVHHAGTEALDQYVGARNRLPCEHASRPAFQIEGD